MSIYSIKNFLETSEFNHFHLKLILFSLFIISFEGYDLAIYGSILPLITEEWALSPTEAGLIGSLGLFGMMFGSIFLGLFADKYGPKKLLILSVIIFSFFTFISAFIHSPLLFSLFRFIAGIGFGGILPILIPLLTEYAPKSSTNKAVTIAIIGNQIGGILAPLIAIIFISSLGLGWQSVLLFAGFPLLILPLIIKNIPESSYYLIKKGELKKVDSILTKINPDYKDKLREESKKNGIKTEKVSIIRLFKNNLAWSTILFCLMYSMGLLALYGVNTWLPKIMVNAGYPLTSSLTFAILLNAGTLIGTICLGIIADKRGAKRLLAIVYTVGAISLALMGIKGSIFLLYFFVTITGFFFFSAHSMLNAFVSQHYPEDLRSTGVGFANGIGRVGAVLGPILGGILISSSAPTNIWFIVFAAPGIIAGLSILLVKNHSQQYKIKADSKKLKIS